MRIVNDIKYTFKHEQTRFLKQYEYRITWTWTEMWNALNYDVFESRYLKKIIVIIVNKFDVLRTINKRLYKLENVVGCAVFDRIQQWKTVENKISKEITREWYIAPRTERGCQTNFKTIQKSRIFFIPFHADVKCLCLGIEINVHGCSVEIFG